MGKDEVDAERVTTMLSVSRKNALERLALWEGVTEAGTVRRAPEHYPGEAGDGRVLVVESGVTRARG